MEVAEQARLAEEAEAAAEAARAAVEAEEERARVAQEEAALAAKKFQEQVQSVRLSRRHVFWTTKAAAL